MDKFDNLTSSVLTRASPGTGIDLRKKFWSVFGRSHMINESQSWVGRTNFRGEYRPDTHLSQTLWYIDLATWCTYIIGQQKVFGCDIISNVIKRYEDKNCYYVSFFRNMHFLMFYLGLMIEVDLMNKWETIDCKV